MERIILRTLRRTLVPAGLVITMSLWLGSAAPVSARPMMALTASFNPASGVLTVIGDALDNSITISRDAAGRILVNGGAVVVLGGTATVANTTLIQVFGQDGADRIFLNEANGALPP